MGQAHSNDRERANVDDVGETEDIDTLDLDLDLDLDNDGDPDLEAPPKKEAKEPKEAIKTKKEIPETITEKKPSTRDALKHAFAKERQDQELETKEKEDVDQPTPENKDPKDPVTNALITAPITWSKEAKADWAKLPPHVQAAITKREAEVSSGFKEYGEKTKKLKEIESVLTPSRVGEFKKYNVSEAQGIDRLFQWMEALASPDRQLAAQNYAALGKSFGIELPQSRAPSNTPNSNPPIELPENLRGFVDSITGELLSTREQVETLARQQQEREATQAREFFENWSKDKPHVERVKSHMYGLLSSGVIPLKNGALDLDTAYNQAIYAIPEIRDLVLADDAEKARQKVEADKKDEELKRLKKLNASKKAASSLSARAPTGNSNIVNTKKNSGKAPQSVAESIRAAIAEHRE